ncbi:MAG: thioredoxin family protein [Gammaproteobacteria bacterium]|nr:thioredoxin family protein [Gammaproteobacteria bacterium]
MEYRFKKMNSNEKASRLVSLYGVYRFVVLIAVAWVTPAIAYAEVSANVVKTNHVTAQLIAEHIALVPGKPTGVALKIAHIPYWHTYWRNSGDSGLPTTLRWTLPPGAQASDVHWPAPQALPFGPLMNFGYEGEVWLISEIRLPTHYTASSATLSAHAEWLVCNHICIPERGEFSVTLPVMAAGSQAPLNPAAATGLARTRALLPLPANGWQLEATRAAEGAVLQVKPPAELGQLRAAHYFPYDPGLVEPSKPQLLRPTDTGYALDISRALQPIAPLTRARGILVTETSKGNQPRVIELDVPITGTENNASTPTTPAATPLTLMAAISLAIIGGLILNVMPCVFPVLSIKVLAFAQETDSRRVRRHGLFYALGVIVSFWLLAALLIGLRAAGQQLGWGFQLQSPIVVAGLALLFFVLALNLIGAIDFGRVLPDAMTSTHARQPDLEAMLSGVLAVAVASPCTGPFMGAALGIAITQSSATSFAVFTALGVGMALPYVLLTAFPGARRLLPKPGAWMERLRQFLAFPLFATVIWLAWVLGMQLGTDAVIYLLGAMLLLGFSVWLARQSRESKRKLAMRVSSLAAAVSAVAVVVWLSQGPSASTPPTSASTDASRWAAYSPQKFDALKAEGKTLFVDFTAAWCITCQVNKRFILETDDVQRAFAARHFTLLRADWTRRDPDITRALEQLGRNGVPVYLIQRPGQPPRLLPEVLSKGVVLQAINESFY